MKIIPACVLLLACLLVAAPALAYTTTKPTVSLTRTTVQATMDTGSVNIRTEPSGAQVYVDGDLKGETPATIYGLSAGSHTILLTHYGYEDMITFVTITPGHMEQYSTRLTPGTGQPEMVFRVPGFESLLAFAGIGAVLIFRKLIP